MHALSQPLIAPCSRILRGWLIVLFAAIAIWQLAVDASAATKRLNVLFIMADDMKNAIGCYGDSLAHTPNVDRLAQRGVRFDRAYCQYPVCNPSRTSLLSGRRPDTTGVVDNVTPSRKQMPDVVFLPQHFRQNGYRTLKVGKIFHTGEGHEDAASWDTDIRETKEAKNPPEAQFVRHQGADKSGIVLSAEDGATWDGFVARKAVELLSAAAAGDQPFFLAAGFRRPHSPYIAPERYFALFPLEKIPPLDEPREHLRAIPPLALTYKNGAKRLPADERAATAAAYYASTAFMDAQLGVLLDAVDRLNIWDNTVVIFASDHGYHLGEHGGLWHKMTLFEESARVPLVIVAPDKQVNASSALVELVDLYPTLVDLCGLPAATGLEGTSCAPLLDHPDREWKSAAFTVVSRVGDTPATEKLDAKQLGRSLRTARWRYTEWPDGQRELYDHDNDAREHVNLAAGDAASDHTEMLRELSSQLKAGYKAALPPTQ